MAEVLDHKQESVTANTAVVIGIGRMAITPSNGIAIAPDFGRATVGGTTTTAYKLTDKDMRTYGGTQWVLGEWREITTEIVSSLCTWAWLHGYRDPLVAVLMNPVHANFSSPRLFLAEVGGAELHNGWRKSGWRRMRLVEELPLPEVSTEQRVGFAILCVWEIYDDADWRAWAARWLSGEDRSTATAWKQVRKQRERVRVRDQSWYAADLALEVVRAMAGDVEYGVGVEMAMARVTDWAGYAKWSWDPLDLPTLARRAMEVAP